MSKELESYNEFLDIIELPVKSHLLNSNDKRTLERYRVLRTQIENALKEKEDQDKILKILKGVIAFNNRVSDFEIDTDGCYILNNLIMKIQRQLENQERKLLRNWILKECFPKELKEYEGAKNHIKALNEERIESSLKLKALEIIKEKSIDVHAFMLGMNINTYEAYIESGIKYGWFRDEPTREEYAILKEVLL